MELKTQLKIALWIYKISKFTQLAYQVSTVIHYSMNVSKELFNVYLSSFMLVVILASSYTLYVNYRALSREDSHFEEYLPLILFLYRNSWIFNHEDRSGFEEDKMSRNPRHLEIETIDKEIETTSKYLVEGALNMRSKLISFMGIKENLSESIDTTSEPSYPLSEDLVYKLLIYISNKSLINVLFHGAVLGALVGIEFIKSRIRKQHQPVEVLEMAQLNNPAINNQ
ncbi:hypothetical protein Anas_09969 [Armadillidium nasatum]|uniref:Uncharacterized protein n=1 Tax=Armadillidium nasatum TaxID=96803 RepID=A0A5N5TIE9_9CRUS|nr:hypothetical protein Anas_09969 [Armadillidium nasatum]